eukprot:6271394-Amphidinium_carterae.1
MQQETAIVIAGIAAFVLDYVPERGFAYVRTIVEPSITTCLLSCLAHVSLIGFAAASLSMVALLAAEYGVLPCGLLCMEDKDFWHYHDAVKWDGAFEATGIILFSTASHSGTPGT